MKTKLVVSYVWYQINEGRLSRFDINRWDVIAQKYWFLGSGNGYETEDEATADLLDFVGDDVYRFGDFCLVKTFRVCEE